MRKVLRLKKQIFVGILLLCVSMVFGVGLGFGTVKEARSAATTTEIVMIPGASVRLGTASYDYGFRFGATLTQSLHDQLIDENNQYKENCEIGMIMVPSKILEAIAKDTDEGKDYFDCIKTKYGKDKSAISVSIHPGRIRENGGEYMFTGAIITIKDANYLLEYQAVVYYTTDGGESYTYTAKSDKRDILHVVNGALTDSDSGLSEILKEKAGGMAEKFVDLANKKTNVTVCVDDQEGETGVIPTIFSTIKASKRVEQVKENNVNVTKANFTTDDATKVDVSNLDFACKTIYDGETKLKVTAYPKSDGSGYYFEWEHPITIQKTSDYYRIEREISKNSLANEVQGRKEGDVNYIFISDLRVDYSANTIKNDEAVKKQLESAVLLANDPANGIDFIAIGGDISNGSYTNKTNYKNAYDETLAPLKESKVPVLILRGDHDDNSYGCADMNVKGEVKTTEDFQKIIDERVVTEPEWYDWVLPKTAEDSGATPYIHDSANTKSAYYYYDLEDKKTRVICLDAADYGTATTYMSGGVHLTARYGATYFGYGASQLVWLADEALGGVMEKGEAWDVIILSHVGYDNSIGRAWSKAMTTPATDHYQYYSGLCTLNDIMKAFTNGDNYKSNLNFQVNGTTKTIAQDYTGKLEGTRIRIYQFGHNASDMFYTDNGAGVVAIATGAAGAYDVNSTATSKPVGNRVFTVYNRAYDDIRESLFDIVVMSKANKRVSKIRFGAGENVEPQPGKDKPAEQWTPAYSGTSYNVDPSKATYGVLARNRGQAMVTRVTEATATEAEKEKFIGTYKYTQNLSVNSYGDEESGGIAFTAIEDDYYYVTDNKYVSVDVYMAENADTLRLVGWQTSQHRYETDEKYNRTFGEKTETVASEKDRVFALDEDGQNIVSYVTNPADIKAGQWYRVYIPVEHSKVLGDVDWKGTQLVAGKTTAGENAVTYIKDITYCNDISTEALTAMESVKSQLAVHHLNDSTEGANTGSASVTYDNDGSYTYTSSICGTRVWNDNLQFTKLIATNKNGYMLESGGTTIVEFDFVLTGSTYEQIVLYTSLGQTKVVQSTGEWFHAGKSVAECGALKPTDMMGFYEIATDGTVGDTPITSAPVLNQTYRAKLKITDVGNESGDYKFYGLGIFVPSGDGNANTITATISNITYEKVKELYPEVQIRGLEKTSLTCTGDGKYTFIDSGNEFTRGTGLHFTRVAYTIPKMNGEHDGYSRLTTANEGGLLPQDNDGGSVTVSFLMTLGGKVDSLYLYTDTPNSLASAPPYICLKSDGTYTYNYTGEGTWSSNGRGDKLKLYEASVDQNTGQIVKGAEANGFTTGITYMVELQFDHQPGGPTDVDYSLGFGYIGSGATTEVVDMTANISDIRYSNILPAYPTE